MKSIGRDPQFQRIRGYLESSVAAGGAQARGRQVHISVGAPDGGGLSTFMDDVKELVGEMGGFEPILVTVESSESPETELFAVQKDVAKKAGLPIPPRFEIQGLFKACDAFLEKTGDQIVLLIDAAAALQAIHDKPDLRERAKNNRLLYVLRYMGTAMQDLLPRIALVVAWNSDFPGQSSQWDAQDVVQRYYPTIWLRSHFDESDPWPTYRRVLEAHGVKVDADYPGFCRSGIPVGIVVEELRRNQQALNGNFLLTLVRDNKRASGSSDAPLDDDILIALCLRDDQIGQSDALWERIERLPTRQRYVHALGNGLYGATGELYESIGTHPKTVMLALEERVRSRLGERDPSLAEDLIQGIAQATDVALAVPPEAREGFYYARLSLDKSRHRPEGSSKMSVEVYVTVADELPAAMFQEILGDIVEISETPGAWAKRSVLAMAIHHDGLLQPLARQIQRVAEEGRNSERIKTFIAPGQGKQASVAPLVTHELAAPAFTQAAYRLADPAYTDVPHLEDSVKRIPTHFKSVLNMWPALTAQSLNPRLLTLFYTHSYEELTQDDIAKHLDVAKSEARDLLKSARALGIVSGKAQSGRWNYSSDQLLERLFAAARESGTVDPKILHDSFFLDDSKWSTIAGTLKHGYGDFFELDEGQLTPKPVMPHLQRRAIELLQQAESLCNDLDAAGNAQQAEHFRNQLRDPRAIFTDADEDAIIEVNNASEVVVVCTASLTSALNLVNEERASLRAQLAEVSTIINAAPNSHDSDLEKRRVDFRTDVSDAAEQDLPLERMTKLIQSTQTLAEELKAIDRDRGRNQASAKRHLAEAQRIKELIGAAQQGVSTLSNTATQNRVLKETNQAIAKHRSISETLRGFASQHPEDSTATVSDQLLEISDRISELKDNLHGIERSIQAEQRTRRKPSPHPEPKPATTIVGPHTTSGDDKPPTDASPENGPAIDTDPPEKPERNPEPKSGAQPTVIEGGTDGGGFPNGDPDEGSDSPTSPPDEVVPTIDNPEPATGPGEPGTGNTVEHTFTSHQIDKLAELIQLGTEIISVKIEAE
jgi:hypothetical protein